MIELLNSQHRLNLHRRLWLLGLPSISGGTFLYDLVGNNHAKIPEDVSRWTPNFLRDGYSLYFPGNSNTILSNFVLRPPTPITISFWNFVKQSDLAGLSFDPISFTIGNRNTPDLVEAAVPARDHILYWDYGVPLSQGRISCSYEGYFDKWTHVVLQSYGYTLSSMKVYLDGKLAASTSKSVAPSATTLTGIYLGGFPAQSRFFKGRMDSFSLWDYFLSPSEVNELYYEETTGYKNTLNLDDQLHFHLRKQVFFGASAQRKQGVLSSHATHVVPNYRGSAFLTKKSSLNITSAIHPHYSSAVSILKRSEVLSGATATVPNYRTIPTLIRKSVFISSATFVMPVYHGAISLSTHTPAFNMTNEEVSAVYRVPPHGSASLAVYPEVGASGMAMGEGFIQKKKRKFGNIA
jgi:hypothetical protein